MRAGPRCGDSPPGRPGDLDAVIITHAHSDHSGSADRARTQAEARVWIHEADAEVARGAEVPHPDGSMARYLLRAEMYRTMLSLGRRGAKRFRTVPVAEVPTFADADTIDVPGRPRAVHAPGPYPRQRHALPGSARGAPPDRRDALVTHNTLTGRTGPQIMPAAFKRDSRQALQSLDQLPTAARTLLPRSRRSVDAGCGRGDPHRQAHRNLVTGKSPRRRPEVPRLLGTSVLIGLARV